MELIDKAAVVAEIKKRINYYQTRNQKWGIAGYAGRVAEGEEILDYINTLEVKEVNLEKEFNNLLDNLEGVPRMHHSDEQIEWGRDIAKHFFELGIKVQNYNGKCKDLGDDGTCMYAANKTGKAMHCENINCSRKIKAQKGE